MNVLGHMHDNAYILQNVCFFFSEVHYMYMQCVTTKEYCNEWGGNELH